MNVKTSGTKIQTLSSQIRRIAKAGGPDVRLPTTRELCRDLNTTPAVLNTALDELEARRIIYRKDRSGIFAAPDITHKTVGVVIVLDSFGLTGGSPFWGMLVHALMELAQECSERGSVNYHFFYVPQFEDEASAERAFPATLLDALNNEMLDGVISVGGFMPLYRLLEMKKLPTVSYASGEGYILNPSETGALHMAAGALAERGCRRVSVWFEHQHDVNLDVQSNRELHMTDFRQALDKFSLPFHPELIRLFTTEVNDRRLPGSRMSVKRLGYEHARALWSRPASERPDSLIVLDDYMTSGILLAFAELGVRVGEDVVIATHANAGSEILFPLEDRLIRMEFDVRTLVIRLFDLYDQVAAGNPPAERKVEFLPTLRLPA
jgi:DNA-binding LacI/PurR family transcriptional regulator